MGQLSLPAANGWAPADMAEDRSMFGLWCITSSPLVLSFDVTDRRALDRAWPVLSNAEAIAVNQAWVGSPGMLVGTFDVGGHAPWEHHAAGGHANADAGRGQQRHAREQEQPPPQPVNGTAFRQLPGEIGMARGWKGVPADTAVGPPGVVPHYMVLRIARSTTLRAAEAWCAANATCAGFYFDAATPSNDAAGVEVWFKVSQLLLRMLLTSAFSFCC